MSILNNSLLLGADAGAAGYQISRSLRFNSADSAYLSRTPASAGNRKTWTWSGWVKLGLLGTVRQIFTARTSGTPYALFYIFSDDKISFADNTLNTHTTAAVYRDPSSWYHIQLAVDTTDATSANRVRLWINGTLQTWASTTAPTQNADGQINTATAHSIGSPQPYASSEYFNGYLADIHFIDGQVLTPSSFTEVSATTGQLIPKQYTGSFGTNGFWLKFSDNSAATATTLGKDYSGNNNNWSPNNLSVLQGNGNYVPRMTSSGGLTFGTTFLNGFDGNITNAVYGPAGGTMTFTPASAILYSTSVEAITAYDSNSRASLNGGSAVSMPNNTWITLASGSGSITSIVFSDSAGGEPGFSAIRVDGVILVDYRAASANDSLVDTPTSYGTDTGAGGEVRGNYATLNPLDKGASVTLTNGNLDVSTASTWNSVRATFGLTSGKWYWEYTMTAAGYTMIGIGTSAISLAGYIGQSSAGYAYYSLTGNKWNSGTAAAYGNSFTTNDVISVAFDADAGKIWFAKNGTWQASGDPVAGANAAYSSIPSGVYFPTISQDNSLPAATGGTLNAGARPFAYTAPSGFKALCDTNLPAPVVAKPSTVMDVLTYSGNGGTTSLATSFSPDMVWIKSRSNAYWHRIFDQIRGAQQELYPNATDTEFTATGGSNSFTSSGFNVASDYANTSGQSFVAWAWDAGSSTVTNTQGSITSQVRANASAGFSIATWTLGSSNVTVGHGLSVAPSLIICKARSNTSQWIVYHASTGVGGYLYLSATSAVGTNIANVWSPVNSTVFGVDTGLFPSSRDYVSYHFAPVAGYSSFGSYTGNGSADGPFVYTGHRSRFLMLKRSDSTGGWYMFDTSREPYNLVNDFLLAHSSAAEQTFTFGDITSSGFKLRDNSADWNASGGTILYVSFSENPFQYARAR